MRLFLSSTKHFGYLNTSGTVETHWSTRWLVMNCIPKCPTLYSRFFSLLLSEELTLSIESPSLPSPIDSYVLFHTSFSYADEPKLSLLIFENHQQFPKLNSTENKTINNVLKAIPIRPKPWPSHQWSTLNTGFFLRNTYSLGAH